MKKKNHLLFLLLGIFAVRCSAQYVEEKPSEKPKDKPTTSFWEKTFVGGNFGLLFGNITMIDLSPNAGYKITENFSAGVGITYIYFSDRRYNYSTNIYGGRIFSRYNFLENFLVHTEYEVLNMELWNRLDFKRDRVNYPRLLLGGGFRQNIGTNSSIMLLVLFNVLDDTEFINKYAFRMPNPDVRVGISIGF
jgi:hypothetical protein